MTKNKPARPTTKESAPEKTNDPTVSPPKPAVNEITLQKDEGSERNRETEQQSNGVTESQSNRATEKQSDRANRDSDATDVIDDSALAACVKTLQDAARLALANGISENCLFDFARAVKAFEVTNQMTLPSAELGNAFCVWWAAAKPHLPADADFDEYQLVFEDTYSRTKSPLGSNSLRVAVERAEREPLPREASSVASSRIQKLIAVCYQLQKLSGNSPFFLSVRDAARILEQSRLQTVSAILNSLVSRGILSFAEKGTPGRRRATRFRFRPAGQSTNG